MQAPARRLSGLAFAEGHRRFASFPEIDILIILFIFHDPMVEETGGFETGRVREQVSEASEADIGEVRENLKQSKKFKQQIKRSQQKNKKQAVLLAVLLDEIDDDELMSKVGKQLFHYKVSVPFVYAQFLPYLAERRDVSKFLNAYPGVATLWEEVDHTISGYAVYLTQLRGSCPELEEVPLDEYVSFVFTLFVWMQLIVPAERDDEKEQSFIASLRTQLKALSASE